MTLLLAFALLLAMVFSARSPATNFAYSQNGHTFQYGHLQFTLPADWQPQPATADAPLGNSQLTLINLKDSDKTITLGVLPATSMRSPAIAMEQAHDMFLKGLEDRPLIQTRLRHGTAVGLLHVSLTPIADLPAELAIKGQTSMGVMNHLMVFSTNAREYVVIHHAQIMAYDSQTLARTQQRLDPAMQLIIAIANQTQNTQYLPAQAPDYAAAGLPKSSIELDKPAEPAESAEPTDQNADRPENTTKNILPATLEMPWPLFTDRLGNDDDSLHLLPHAGPPLFWTVRLLGTITPTSLPAAHDKPANDTTNASDTNNVATQLLAYIQADQYSQNIANSQIVSISQPNIQGWKLIAKPQPDTPPAASDTQPASTPEHSKNLHDFASQNADPSTNKDGLVRELWLIPLPNQRALIAQLIAEPQALSHAANQLANAIKLHISTLPKKNAGPTLHDNWAQAVVQGENIVSEIRSNIQASQKPGLKYTVLRVEDIYFGVAMLQTVHGDDPLPIRGREVGFILTAPTFIHDIAWSGDATLGRMWMTKQKRDLNEKTFQPVASTQSLTDTRRVLRDGQLTSYAINAQGKQTTTQWSHETTANFLPQLALYRLNAKVLKILAAQPPALVMYAQDDNSPEPCWFKVRQIDNHWLLTLRPTATIDPISIWYDQQGEVTDFRWTHTYPNYGGLMRFASTTTDRDNILKAFIKFKPQIIAWEKELQPDE